MVIMTEKQIPDFVSDIVATGCDIRAVADFYVIADADLPDDVYEAVEPELMRISETYGERDHLKAQITNYLYSIGRCYPPPVVQ
ncbi:hypothetical protein ABID21_004207 [Pseudorhizobium tarimense]|uniref:Uncharacterized protein n=1 Tax=Pseudorhizobium tarimense TaxID=1079109 RepID=A0ABV2HAP3_9HYPH|nr:hypothetical protein [Pseudorhizobium tarimense]MCJ8521154.1 hypothetical protein [Pseudorhizobium tarimense]